MAEYIGKGDNRFHNLAKQSICQVLNVGNHSGDGNEHLDTIYISLQISRQKWTKSKINKYKINNNNNKTNWKHESNVKYEGY